jgi:hypothetical protein
MGACLWDGNKGRGCKLLADAASDGRGAGTQKQQRAATLLHAASWRYVRRAVPAGQRVRRHPAVDVWAGLSARYPTLPGYSGVVDRRVLSHVMHVGPGGAGPMYVDHFHVR